MIKPFALSFLLGFLNFIIPLQKYLYYGKKHMLEKLLREVFLCCYGAIYVYKVYGIVWGIVYSFVVKLFARLYFWTSQRIVFANSEQAI